jgi:PAS domain S-box-containing protein
MAHGDAVKMDLVAELHDTPHSFLKNGGELSRRIASHDWAQTPLGPIEFWPQSLRGMLGFMLASPVPLVLLWGEQGVMIYNDAYSVFAGGRDSRLLGSNVREGWDEISDFNDNVMRVGLAGGTLSYRNHELTLLREGRPERVWMNLDYSPVLGDDGKPAGVIAVVVETSEAVHSRRAHEQSETRLRFLDELGQAVAASPDAAEVLAITARMTAQHMGLSNCAYADVNEAQDRLTIRDDWHAPGTPSIVGEYGIAQFGKRAMRELRAGRPLVVNDVAAQLDADEGRTFLDLGASAVICMPLIKDGRLAALMAILENAPREWSEYDLNLMREVTDRSWAHIQRVGAEGALREREAYNRQILDGAIDYGIVATDLEGRVTLWNRGAAEMLGWSEPEMIGQPIATFFTPEDRALGRPEAKRREALEQGRAHDARWHLRKSGERFWGLSEMTPLRDARGNVIGLVKLMRDRTVEYEAQEALQLSEERLRRAQAAGGVGLFSVDIESDRISATEEFCRIFGIEPRDELPAEEVQRLVVPEDKRLVSDRKTRGSGSALLDIEYRIHRADTGEERTIARRADYEFDGDGVRTRLVGVVQDVTDRLRIQRALEKSEAQFSALAQNMPNHVWTAQADGWFDWFNDQVYTYSGAAPGSLTGSRWTVLVHPDDLARTLERWSASLATGEAYEAEHRLRDAQGRYRWHLTRAQPLTDTRGAITAWVGTNTEIEAQKQAEVESVQDRERLWKSSQDLMLVCNLDGLITAVNPSAERMLGWNETEIVGHYLSDFLHPEDLAATAREMESLNQGETTFAFENRYRTKDESYRLIAWTAVPANGRIHAIGRDITDQREVEEALRQSQKMEAVGQLTGGIAHDFNNLLQGITGSLDIMQTRLSRGRTDDLGKWLEGARGSAERAAALTHRLLAFSRRQPLDPRPVQANPLIESMEDLLQRTLGENIALDLALDEELWLTRCDPNQLESAILNLAINARDAMPDGGLLTIATSNVRLDSPAAAQQREVRPGHYVCVSVTDTGTGMARETIARAFEPFFTTKPTGQGTGLGLSMIYGFARQSEGHAVIESVVDEGTSIKLYLPRHRGADLAEDNCSGLEASLSTDAGEMVLVVEDEPVVRGLIVEVLRELGYHAIEAADGPEGLAILQGHGRIDLLVTDIGLPGLNGSQVADAARMVRPDLKVLFMTGYAENAALASGFLEPGMALITKPFAMDVLANKIREIIES